jgi:DNA gyrase/topoisomerase IV subunit A
MYFLSHVGDINTSTFKRNLSSLMDLSSFTIIGQDDIKSSIIIGTNTGRIARILVSAITERGWNYPVKLIKIFDDKIINAYLDNGEYNYLFISKNGRILRSSSKVCATLKRRYTGGARAFDLKEGDEIVSFFLVPIIESENDRIIILDENGNGKGVSLSSIKARQKLTRSGNKLFNAKEFSEIKLVGGCYSNNENDLIVIGMKDICYYIYSKYFTNNSKRALGKKIIASDSIKFIKRMFI